MDSGFFAHLCQALPDPVFRKDLTRLTGGILNSRSLANADSRGFGGIKNPYTIGGQGRIAYAKKDVLEYLQSITSLRKQKPGKFNQGIPSEGEQNGGCHETPR